MAQRTVFVDDLDGTEADGTHTFALDGATYEVDLSAKNAEVLRDRLADFISAGRQTGQAKATRARGGTTRSRGKKLAEIRAWARGEGLTVSNRGRISDEVLKAWEAAQAGR